MDSSHEGSTSEDATGESKAPKNKIEETKIEKQEETVEAQNNDETDIENPKQETTSRPSVEIEERSHHTAESSEGEAKFTSEYVRNTTDTDIPSDQEHQPDPTISRKKKSVKIEEIHLKEQKKNVENPLIYISPPENSEATSPSPTIKPSKKEDSENDNDTRNEDSLDERRFINGLDILTGLTTEEAVKKLLQVMKETMNELEHHKESKLQILRTYLKEVNAPALLGCLAFLLAAFIVEATSLKVIPRIIVEFGLLILCFLVSCFLVFRDRTHKNDIINRARAHIKNFELHGDPYLKLWIDSTIVNSSISTVSVLRDGKWQKIPLNHLVEGDIVGLVHNEIAPVKLKCIEPQFDGNLLEPGQGTDAFHLPDILRVSTPLNKKLKFTKSNRLLALTERCRFIALETPAAQQLRISIKSPKKPQSPVENNIAYTNTICSWILWISLIISAIVDIIRFFLQKQGRTTSQWVNLLLLRQAYLSIPFLHLSLPLLLAFCWAFGNAKILAIFDWIQHKYEKHNPPKHTETHDEWEVDHGDGKLPPKVLDLFMKYFLTILRGNNPTISPSLRLVHELGSITVVCCVDKDGVLSDVNLQAEKIYLHKSEESPNVLELSRISNVGLKFDDRNWSEHIMILKPLGLNCLLNKNCRPLESSKLEVPVHVHRLNCLLEREDPYNVYSRCLCSLGKEIGFTDDALENFIRVKEIHTFFPTIDKHLTKKKTTTPPSSYLLSLVIRDKSSTSLQLLSRGSTDAVLEHCNSFWDGQGIKPLTPEDKAKIIQLSNDWTNTSDCISFSYKPIDKKLHWLFSNEESNEKNPVCIHLKRGDAFEDIISIEGTSVVKTKKKKGSFLSLQELENQSETESVSSDGASKHDSLRQLQKNQIFIGMAAVKEQPKVNLPKSVEVWRHAGIRFVFFSNETYDSSTKSFVGRLGLETDWNCCISLDENDNKQNYLNSNNVVFLPKGIKQIRSHLADDIDNVPLLVPMFSDATPETSTEMLKIFQEYGDVVCCIGSTLNTDNSSVFARSDVAIGIEPPFKLCVNEEEKAEELLPLITSSNFLKLNSSGSLSTDITGLSCPLIMHRKTNIHDLIQLIRSSRHLLINIKQALMFYLLCNSTLEILLLMSYCVLPSYFHILTGVQLTWLVWTIIPTLSLCLLTSRGESDILDSISPKNLKNPDVVRFVVRNLLYRLALTTFVLLGIFLRTFHALYSDDLNSTERWNIIFGSGDQSEDFSLSQDFQSALSSSQTVLMFAFSFHMGVYSLCWAYNKRSIFTKPILIHPIMVVGIFVSLIVQVVWNAVQTAISPPFLLHKLPWEIYVLVFGWPIVLIAVDELIKHGERKWITTYQKELRLEFDTRLGRYSPK